MQFLVSVQAYPRIKRPKITQVFGLGKPSIKKSAVFFNIVQKAFDPPPLSFEHYVVNFSEGILTKVRKRLSRQLSTK